ncbi:MAG: hypothetical protein KDD44_14260, partial [Bdellovibrionales bacterium]|nr:hypothetical protein [Bdellovibrionales bacterium]
QALALLNNKQGREGSVNAGLWLVADCRIAETQIVERLLELVRHCWRDAEALNAALRALNWSSLAEHRAALLQLLSSGDETETSSGPWSDRHADFSRRFPFVDSLLAALLQVEDAGDGAKSVTLYRRWFAEGSLQAAACLLTVLPSRQRRSFVEELARDDVCPRLFSGGRDGFNSGAFLYEAEAFLLTLGPDLAAYAPSFERYLGNNFDLMDAILVPSPPRGSGEHPMSRCVEQFGARIAIWFQLARVLESSPAAVAVLREPLFNWLSMRFGVARELRRLTEDVPSFDPPGLVWRYCCLLADLVVRHGTNWSETSWLWETGADPGSDTLQSSRWRQLRTRVGVIGCMALRHPEQRAAAVRHLETLLSQTHHQDHDVQLLAAYFIERCRVASA